MINVECGIVGTGGTGEGWRSEVRGFRNFEHRTAHCGFLASLANNDSRFTGIENAVVRLRPSDAWVRFRVVLLRHAVPERGFLACCRGSDGRHQGDREQ